MHVGLSGSLTEMPTVKVRSPMGPTKIKLLIKPALPRLPSDMAAHLPSGTRHKVQDPMFLVQKPLRQARLVTLAAEEATLPRH